MTGLLAPAFPGGGKLTTPVARLIARPGVPTEESGEAADESDDFQTF
jgi:hypothetical protein